MNQRLHMTWMRFKQNRPACLGLWVIVFFFVFAMMGFVLTQRSQTAFNPRQVRLPDKFKTPLSLPSADLMQLDPGSRPPFGLYIFGTDEFGRDVFSRMLEGAKVSLSVGFVAVGISLLVGIILGSLSGYFKKLDPLIMKAVDVMLCFPSFFLILTIVALRPQSIWNIMLVIGLTSWMGTCRFVRAEFLSLRELDFVQAARSLGLPNWRIIFRHLLPNSLSPVLVSANLSIASAILLEAGLSYLGLGVPPPQATWGNILTDSQNYLFDAPHLIFIPGITIFLTVLGFFLVGEGLREATHPKYQPK